MFDFPDITKISLIIEKHWPSFVMTYALYAILAFAAIFGATKNRTTGEQRLSNIETLFYYIAFMILFTLPFAISGILGYFHHPYDIWMQLILVVVWVGSSTLFHFLPIFKKTDLGMLILLNAVTGVSYVFLLLIFMLSTVILGLLMFYVCFLGSTLVIFCICYFVFKKDVNLALRHFILLPVGWMNMLMFFDSFFNGVFNS